MARLGHLRELKEWKNLLPLLQQVATQIQGTVHLVQADQTIVGKAQASQQDLALGCLPEVQYATLIMQWLSAGALTWPQEMTCSCGHFLFVLPLHKESSLNGILVGCSPIKENRALLASIADIIQDYLALARDAVQQWKKFNLFWGASETLHERTQDVGKLTDLIDRTLLVLRTCFHADFAIFIPRSDDDKRWEFPFMQCETRISREWAFSLSSQVTRLHDEDGQYPLALTPDDLPKYPDLQPLGPFSLLVVSVTDDQHNHGLLLLCARGTENSFSFDDLALLERLKQIFIFRLLELNTQRVVLELQIRQSREHLFSEIFHNCNTPTHAILGITEKLISAQKIDDCERQKWLGFLYEEVQRLVASLARTQELSWLSQTSNSQAIVSLRDIVEKSVKRFRLLAEKKYVTISLTVPAEDCNVVANNDALMVVLQNLLENAVKFSQAGQTIQVGLTVEPGDYRVNVIDEGPGVPEEQREEIFTEFRSIPRAGVPEGTGLGLGIARSIVVVHGGTLYCDANPAGHGAWFWFTLPLSDNDTLMIGG